MGWKKRKPMKKLKYFKKYKRGSRCRYFTQRVKMKFSISMNIGTKVKETSSSNKFELLNLIGTNRKTEKKNKKIPGVSIGDLCMFSVRKGLPEAKKKSKCYLTNFFSCSRNHDQAEKIMEEK